MLSMLRVKNKAHRTHRRHRKKRATDEHGQARKEEAMSYLEDALSHGNKATLPPGDGKSGRADEKLYLRDGSFYEKDATLGLRDA